MNLRNLRVLRDTYEFSPNFLKSSKLTNPTMKQRVGMFTVLSCRLATAALLCAGCMTANEDRLHKKVMTWARVGTSAEEATHIMEHHGFQCSPPHRLQGAMPGENP